MPRTPQDFVDIVKRDVDRGEICILYAEALFSAFADPNKIWPEMLDEAFRDAVQSIYLRGDFFPPDSLDGWVYYAYPPKTTTAGDQ